MKYNLLYIYIMLDDLIYIIKEYNREYCSIFLFFPQILDIF